jgi:hypothetical protein
MNEVAARKARTEALLKDLGVPVCPGLPFVESESEARIRNAGEVAKRCGVLYARTCLGHDCDRGKTLRWLDDEGLWDCASNAEKDFFNNPQPTQEDTFAATWEIEKINILLWSLGYIERLELPRGLCNVPLIRRIFESFEPVGGFHFQLRVEVDW